MRRIAPKKLALLVSLGTGAGTALLLALLSLLFPTAGINWVLLLTSGTIITGLSFLGLQFSFGQYLNRHMSRILKTLSRSKEEPPEPRKFDWGKDILYQLNLELVNWGRENQRTIQDLRKAENYRREFVGNVSHELKTPIFNVQGYIHTLLDGGIEDPGINRKYLEKAGKNIERLSAIVEDLEAISQLESGELRLSFERFDLKRLASDVIESLEMAARERHIQLCLEASNSRPWLAKGDIGRIRQVLTNLLTNAIKYGSDHGTCTITFYDQEDHLEIAVSDDGIGIEPEHLNRLFERFYRVDKSRSREQGGTGLGLSIVKHILEAHGQSISVESEPGVGTTFRFSLSKPA